MAPEKFQTAFDAQECVEIDWDDAMNTVEMLSIMQSQKTDISPEQVQLVLVMEELSELSQEISKVIRRCGNPLTVMEELADVCVMCKYIQHAMDISDEDLNRAINVKLKRYSLAVPNTETK